MSSIQNPDEPRYREVLRLINEMERERKTERQERTRAEAQLRVQLAAYDALLAGAFPTT